MEITKELLSTYRSKKDEIVELDWMLNNRWRSETMIGNDVIFDYSKGYPMPQSVVGFDQEKYDRAQERDLRKKKELEQECVEIEEWVEAITDSITRRIFRMCFIEGRRQKDVDKAVHMDRSNVSKRIDTYLQLSHNSHDSHV